MRKKSNLWMWCVKYCFSSKFCQIYAILFQMQSLISSLVILLITVVAYLFNKTPETAPFRGQIIYVSLFALLFFIYFTEKSKTSRRAVNLSIYLLTTFVLFLVASTGWFSSPFSFLIYFLLLVYGLMYAPFISMLFIVSLIFIIFTTSDKSYEQTSRNFLIVVSLLSAVPIAVYLRQKYLSLMENSKDILILKKKEENYLGGLDDVLENRISFFAAVLRQPISTIKNLAFRLSSELDEEKSKQIRERIITSSDEALSTLKKFEEESTGRKLVSREKNFSPSPPA